MADAEPHVWARPLTPEFAADFHRFHDRAGASSCHCMYWHFDGDNATWMSCDPVARRAAKASRIAECGDTGMLLFEDTEPVGWLGFGLRKSFPKLVERLHAPPGPDDLWCITCVEIDVAKRHQGYARVLLAIALEHLLRMGVKEIEAYPAPEEDQLDADQWRGPRRLFLDAGFEPTTEGGAFLRKRF